MIILDVNWQYWEVSNLYSSCFQCLQVGPDIWESNRINWQNFGSFVPYITKNQKQALWWEQSLASSLLNLQDLILNKSSCCYVWNLYFLYSSFKKLSPNHPQSDHRIISPCSYQYIDKNKDNKMKKAISGILLDSTPNPQNLNHKKMLGK